MLLFLINAALIATLLLSGWGVLNLLFPNSKTETDPEKRT
jgi:hypothetical protein